MNPTTPGRTTGKRPTTAAAILLLALLLHGCGAAVPVPPTPAAGSTATLSGSAPAPIIVTTYTPTSEPTATAGAAGPASGRTAGPTSQAAAAGTPYTNNAGFTFIVPAGWQVVSNEGTADLGGAAELVPAGTSAENPDTSILIDAGESLFFLPEVVQLGPAASLESVLDAIAEQASTGGGRVFNRQQITLNGRDAIAASVDDPVSEGSIVIARLDERRWFRILGFAPRGQWQQESFDVLLASLQFFEPSSSGHIAIMTPQPVPTPLPRPTALENTDTISPDGEVINQAAGFALMPPDGWQVAWNRAASTGGGLTVVIPAGADPARPATSIYVSLGPSFFTVGETQPPAPNAPLDEVIQAIAAARENGTPLAEPATLTVGGSEGRMLDLALEDPAMGQGRVRIVIARLDVQRLFTMLAFTPADQWDEARFNEVLQSIRFIEPGQPAPTIAAEASIFPLPPSAQDIISLDDSGGVAFQTSLSPSAVLSFYREEFARRGATAQEPLLLDDGSFSIAFAGWSLASGRAVVVVGTPTDSNGTIVSIQFDDSQ